MPGSSNSSSQSGRRRSHQQVVADGDNNHPNKRSRREVDEQHPQQRSVATTSTHHVNVDTAVGGPASTTQQDEIRRMQLRHRVSISPDRDEGPQQQVAAASAVSVTCATIQREPLRSAGVRTSAAAAASPPPVYKKHLAAAVVQHHHATRGPWNLDRLAGALLIGLSLVCTVGAWWVMPSSSSFVGKKFPSHILPPKHYNGGGNLDHNNTPVLTLRDVLTDSDTSNGFHLALAPAFFGFYGYFGALAAWEDFDTQIFKKNGQLQSVAGGSAGAMAAILLAAGVSPRNAAHFCTKVTLDQFADFPGVLGMFKGDLFEQTMANFLHSQVSGSLLLQDAVIPVAVSAFDLQTMTGQILQQGSMARAARASATFPLLFQPVSWAAATTSSNTTTNKNDEPEDYVFIDGGIADFHGLRGLQAFLKQPAAAAAAAAGSHGGTSSTSSHRQRVVNLLVNGFGTMPGPSAVRDMLRDSSNNNDDDNNGIIEVISVTLQNLPQCGPWNLKDGPKTVEAARRAMAASLDVPLFAGAEGQDHYELHIDTRPFWKTNTVV